MRTILRMVTAPLLAVFFMTYIGHLSADTTLSADTALIESIGGQDWHVYQASGGHMVLDDEFEIAQDDEDKIKLIPGKTIRKRWGMAGNPSPSFKLSEENLEGGEKALCGFIELDTDEHQETEFDIRPFGHNKLHGILITKQSGNSIKIRWSALPLKDKPNTYNRNAKCNKLKKLHHGGVAHART